MGRARGAERHAAAPAPPAPSVANEPFRNRRRSSGAHFAAAFPVGIFGEVVKFEVSSVAGT